MQNKIVSKFFHRKSKVLIFVTGLVLFAFFQNFKSVQKPTVVSVDLNLDKVIASKSDGFFGSNILYWIDTDQAIDKPSINPSGSGSVLIDRYNELGISRLRFPAGGAAENYNWETNRLEDSTAFPKEAKDEDLDNRMDTLEFCRFKEKAKIDDATFVVNIRGPVRLAQQDILKDKNIDKNTYTKLMNLFEKHTVESIERAKRWVKYANQKHNCKIKDWEIGNESYHNTFTAKEYANLLIRYSAEMKKIDPTIRIGAIGPWADEAHEIAFMDRLTPEAVISYRKIFREEHKEEKLGIGLKEYAAKLNKNKTPEKMDLWWPTVAKLAKGHFDFIVTHRYDTRRKQSISGKGIPLKEEAFSIQEAVRIGAGKKLPIIMTEWNVGSEASESQTTIQHSLALAEMMANYLSAGMHGGNFWPARLHGHPYTLLKTKKDFVENDQMELLSPGQVFKFFSKNVLRQIVQSSTTDESVDSLVSTNADKSLANIILINRQNTPIKIQIPKLRFSRDVKINALVEAKSEDEKEPQLDELTLKESPNAKVFEVLLPALSMTRINIKR